MLSLIGSASISNNLNSVLKPHNGKQKKTPTNHDEQQEDKVELRHHEEDEEDDINSNNTPYSKENVIVLIPSPKNTNRYRHSTTTKRSPPQNKKKHDQQKQQQLSSSSSSSSSLLSSSSLPFLSRRDNANEKQQEKHQYPPNSPPHHSHVAAEEHHLLSRRKQQQQQKQQHQHQGTRKRKVLSKSMILFLFVASLMTSVLCLSLSIISTLKDDLEQQQWKQQQHPLSLQPHRKGARHQPTHREQNVQQPKQRNILSTQKHSDSKKPSLLPRVVYFDTDASLVYRITNNGVLPMKSIVLEEHKIMQEQQSDDGTNNHDDDTCSPMAKWQSQAFVNCNALHEIDLGSAVIPVVKPTNTTTTNSKYNEAGTVSILGQGWFRTTWKYTTTSNRRIQLLEQQETNQTKSEKKSLIDFDGNEEAQEDESLVLKTLRLERDFVPEFYELHRRDATAMERLTHSKFVIDIYGYCGQSAINELADYLPKINSIETFDRQLRGKESFPYINHIKLKMAASVALGLTHIHHSVPPDSYITDENYDDSNEEGVDDSNDNHANNNLDLDDYDSTATPPATIVHYDINPRNIAVTKGGRPKINDFNTARFLRWNEQKQTTCGFKGNLHDPWWRAPEEVALDDNNTVSYNNSTERLLLTEKIDIYALGNILFHILTTHSPRGKMKKDRMEHVRELVSKGIKPELPAYYKESQHPAHVVFRNAMDLCFRYDPNKRGTAKQVAKMLYDGLIEERKRSVSEMQQQQLQEQQKAHKKKEKTK